MIGRDSKSVLVAFSSTEILWISAANSLPKGERWAALVDISDMAGRAFASVHRKADELARLEAWERARQARLALAEGGMPRRVMVPESPAKRPHRRKALTPGTVEVA